MSSASSASITLRVSARMSDTMNASKSTAGSPANNWMVWSPSGRFEIVCCICWGTPVYLMVECSSPSTYTSMWLGDAALPASLLYRMRASVP